MIWLNLLDKRTRSDPNNVEETLVRKKRIEIWNKKIDDYTRTIELNPKNAEAYGCRGFAYSELGQHHKAIEDTYQAGLLYLKQGDRTKALECVYWMKGVDSSFLGI